MYPNKQHTPTNRMTFMLVDIEIIEIIDNPSNRDVYAIVEIIFLFWTRFTMEWNLNSSIPVSESNKSFVRFSQISINIAAIVNAIKLDTLIFLKEFRIYAPEIKIGKIATE